MKKFTLVVSLFLVLGACLSFAGCSPNKKDADTVVLWHWMNDRHEALETLAARYEKETGTPVEVDLFSPSHAYTQRITASAQIRDLPDIFGILDEKEIFASYVKNGFVADLTKEYAKNDAAWEKALFAKALNVNRFKEGNIYGVKPGLYGVPLDVTNIQMVYNKALLAKAGISTPPATFEEFLNTIDTLNRVGITGLVSGWGEMWMLNCFASNYAFNIMGQDKIMATYRGEVPYTDPDWVEVFEIFETLRERDALADGIVTKQNKFAEQDFALGRAAFAFNGSWCVNVYHGMNADLDYGVILPPPVNDTYPMKIWGGAGSSFVVNKNSPSKEKAIAFLRWLTAKDQQAFLSQETKNLPANKDAVSDIPQILSDFAVAMDNTTHPTIWKYNELPKVSFEFGKALQSIIVGDLSPEEAAAKVQKIKTAEMEKERKRQQRRGQ
jgi:ABC-type glycerol-3-phosphate transport system substrate-binding protein